MVAAFLRALLVLASAAAAAPVAAACADPLPPSSAALAPIRVVSPRDLAMLRDIGYPDAGVDFGSPLALSPDGRWVAFVLARGQPDDNLVCRALVLIASDGRAPPRVIDRGGELPLVKSTYRGMYVTTGFPDVVVPAFSPDGRWIAYLKRLDGRTQVWRARADGDGAEPVTVAPSDVEALAWSADGTAIVFATRPGVAAGERALDREALAGYHYDARSALDVTVRPNLWAADVPLAGFVAELATGRVRPATAVEAARVLPPTTAPNGAALLTAKAAGLQAWTQRVGDNPLGPSRLWTTDAAGRRLACARPACTGTIVKLWLESTGAVLFQRREGWNNEDSAIYRWDPAHDRLARIMRTRDALTGCIHGAGVLLCGRENATTPRRIVAIDLRTGRDRLLFDPNPEFARLTRGTVTRLRWRNDRGLPAWGDLVLPAGHRAGTRLPLVVVVYFSRGFLRGGIGDEYPIYALAARGFAVLSFERPPHVASRLPGIRSYDDVNGAGRIDWAERRSILSAVTAGVDQAIARGVVDPARVGITGLSDGATNVAFALIHTRRYAAAAMSSCCDSPVSNLAIGGPAWAEWNHRVMGYPLTIADDRAFWKPFAMSVNARRIDTPLLLQLADREALLSLETYAALREAAKPVDLYVFPDEYHNKWQPAHRLAIYDRNLDWFSFWLQDRRDPDPAKRSQYERWAALRAGQLAPDAGKP